MDEKELNEIAELAVLGCKRNPQAHTTQECMNCEFHPHSCNQWQHAEKAINAGYQKIQEDSIVLSKEEYDDLKRRPSTREWVDTCRGRMEQASKETTKEIFNKIKNKVLSENTDDGYGYESIDMWDIEDIFKEYGVEVEE